MCGTAFTYQPAPGQVPHPAPQRPSAPPGSRPAQPPVPDAYLRQPGDPRAPAPAPTNRLALILTAGSVALVLILVVGAFLFALDKPSKRELQGAQPTITRQAGGRNPYRVAPTTTAPFRSLNQVPPRPRIVHDTIVTIDNSTEPGVIIGSDLITSATRWTRHLGCRADWAPGSLTADDRLLVTCSPTARGVGAEEVSSLDPVTGQDQWLAPRPCWMATTSRTAIVCRATNTLLGVDPSSGRDLWSYTSGIDVEVLADDRFVFSPVKGSMGNRELVAVDLVSGIEAWRSTEPWGDLIGLTDDALFVRGENSAGVVALNPLDGSTKAALLATTPIGRVLSSDPTMIIVYDFGGGAAGLAWDATTPVWQYKSAEPAQTRKALRDSNRVVIVDGPESPPSTTQIVVLDATTGELLKTWNGITAGGVTMTDGLIVYVEVGPNGERRLVKHPVP